MKCEECKYWDFKQHSSRDNLQIGWCYRFPPSLPFDANPEVFRVNQWPSVMNISWCGEFEAKTHNIPFSLDGFVYGHKGDVSRFLRIAERTATDPKYKEQYPMLHPIRTMDDFLSLSGETVLRCKTIGPVTWREIQRLQEQIRQKL